MQVSRPQRPQAPSHPSSAVTHARARAHLSNAVHRGGAAAAPPAPRAGRRRCVTSRGGMSSSGGMSSGRASSSSSSSCSGSGKPAPASAAISSSAAMRAARGLQPPGRSFGGAVSLASPSARRLERFVTHADGGGSGGSSGGGGGDDGGGDGGGGDGSNDGDDDDKLLSFKEVEAFMKDRKVKLPSDMMETAKVHGLRLKAINAFLAAQGFVFTGWLCRTIPFFRDRILGDPRFLFKVGAEVAIDSGCATVAEVRKRGDDFWKELELYLSDLLVGLVMDVVMVSLMAPALVIGGATMVSQRTGVQKFVSSIPSAVFAANTPGVSYSAFQRMMCIVVKFGEYSLAGITCGLVGQGIANFMMEARRSSHSKDGQLGDEDLIPVPPLVKTALVWGLFMGVSSNLRYQAVFGIERLVDVTLAKRIPALAYITTLVARFVNNVIGGENFIDMARWAGVQ